jgi:predicted permease
VELDLHGFDEERGRRFYQRLLEGASALPRATVVALTNALPVTGEIASSTVLYVLREGLDVADDDPRSAHGQKRLVRCASVTAGYLDAIGLPIQRGRGVSAGDVDGSMTVAVVSESAARRLWSHNEPIGQRLSIPDSEGWVSVGVVGVVKDTGVESRIGGSADPVPWIYVPFAQRYSPGGYLMVRTAADPRGLVDPLTALVRQTDPDVAVIEGGTLDEQIRHGFYALNVGSWLLSGLAACGLFLACVGLYSLVAYLAAHRAREIGIRMALGATAGQVTRMVLWEGLRVVVVGIAAGLLLALWAGQLVSGMLFGTTGHDTAVFVVVPVLLTAVSLLACYAPARRVAGISPAEALRHL